MCLYTSNRNKNLCDAMVYILSTAIFLKLMYIKMILDTILICSHFLPIFKEGCLNKANLLLLNAVQGQD